MQAVVLLTTLINANLVLCGYTSFNLKNILNKLIMFTIIQYTLDFVNSTRVKFCECFFKF